MSSVFTGGNHADVIENIEVRKGYEAALESALGNDLEAALDPRAPVFWHEIAGGRNDPALPEGVVVLSDVVRAPAASCALYRKTVWQS